MILAILGIITGLSLVLLIGMLMVKLISDAVSIDIKRTEKYDICNCCGYEHAHTNDKERE